MRLARRGAGHAVAAGAGWVGLGLALAWAALAICGYRFGTDDQVQYLAQYTHVRHPGALAGDAYVQAFGALGSVVWGAIALATPEASLPAVALGVMLASVAASALVLVWLGRGLLGRRAALVLAAAPAIVLVTPKEQNYLGLVSLGDVELTATVLAMTLVFASMTLFVRGRVVLSLVAAAGAAPIHGQTAAYLLGAWCAATLLAHRRDRRLVALVLAVGALGVVGAGLARTIGPVPAERMGEYAELGRELYAPLIDVRHVPLKSWGALLFVLAFGALALPGYLRRASYARAGVRTRRERLLVYGVGSLAFPVLGAGLLIAGVEEPLLWRLMVPRSLMLVQIVSLVVAGVWAADRVRDGGGWALLGAATLAGLAVWPTPALGHLAAGGVGLATLALIAAGSVRRGRRGLEASRSRVRGVLGAGPAWAALLVSAGALFALRERSWLSGPDAPAWRDVQAWARTSTPGGSVFVTPPYLAGWRVGSHRPTFGELRDGGLLFYAGEPALAWEERMRLLGMRARAWWREVDPREGGEPHASLRGAYADAITAGGDALLGRTGAGYVVVERGGAPALGGPVYANELFEVYEVGGARE